MENAFSAWGHGYRLLTSSSIHRDRLHKRLNRLSIKFTTGTNHFDKDCHEFPFYTYVRRSALGSKVGAAISSAEPLKEILERVNAYEGPGKAVARSQPRIEQKVTGATNELGLLLEKIKVLQEDDAKDAIAGLTPSSDASAQVLVSRDEQDVLDVQNPTLGKLVEVDGRLRELDEGYRSFGQAYELIVKKLTHVERSLKEISKQREIVDSLEEFVRQEKGREEEESGAMKIVEGLHKTLEMKNEQIAALEKDNRDYESIWEESQKRVEELRQKEDEWRLQQENLESLEKQSMNGLYLRTLTEALELLSRRHPRTLVVLPEAIKTSKEFDKARKHTMVDVHRLLDWVESLATHLAPLLANPRESEKELSRAFQKSSTYELALTERGQTKNDPTLKKQRSVTYRQETVICWAHIKYKIQDIKVRCHFYIDNERGKIVIGSCGFHLNTAWSKGHN